MLSRSETRPKILIVDDRRENLFATEKVLRPLSAEIFKASSGNEALSIMLRHRFAVVLLDVQMPEMDGFETAMLMQEHEAMTNTPIIFVTALSKEERYATQAAEIGAVDYIFKPINPEILKSKVKVYLDLFVQREEILALNDVLQQSNEELERFAYVCSHDLQEPVRMMSAYAGVLSEHCAERLGEDGGAYVSYISANAQRMQRLIQDILTFSRVGREKVEVETVDSGAIVQEVLEELHGMIEARKARITFGELPVLDTAPTLLRVLFLNLVGNALKFNDGQKPPEIIIGARREDNAWRFMVGDNGIGIDPTFRADVFTIFRRYHRKDEYPGTGIGLSTCQKFLRLFGGDIDFDSVPGEGTTFTFLLPHLQVARDRQRDEAVNRAA